MNSVLRQCGRRFLSYGLSPSSVTNSGKISLAVARPSTYCVQSRLYSVFEPDDLDTEPEVPEYEALNIRMRAYDYVPLESYAKFVHSIIKNMGLESESFPVPARTSRIQNYKPFSTNIEHTYNLAVYERTVQVEDLPSTMAPILLEVLQQNAPEGVDITVKEPDPEEDDFRYVPDIMLMELQAQVEELDKIKEDRRKK